jgi:glucose/arabinose dehydrogenase
MIRSGLAGRKSTALMVALVALAQGIFGCNARPEPTPVAAPTPAPSVAENAPIIPPSKIEPVQVRHVTPKRQIVRPADMPKPYATPSIDNGLRELNRPTDAILFVPPGFTIHEWAAGLDNPRIITVAPNGDVFVAESGPNRVIILRDEDKDGLAEYKTIYAENLRQPFGIAFYPPGPEPKYIYIANTDSIIRYPYKKGDTKARGAAETLISDLPGGGYNQHWTRNIVFRPDGKKMYVSVGSQTNVGEEEEKRAAILEYNPDGTGYRVYASGIRNPVGLAFHPETNALWTACNERDGLGDDLVPDYVTSVKEGGFYGWPWYYIGPNPDPTMKEKPELKKKVIVPDVLFTAHAAALGIEFYTAKQFPKAYRNNAFVAQHGSWNRVKRSGYQIVRIAFDRKGKPTGGFEPFIWGWCLPDGKVWGRPVDMAVTPEGSMLITDDALGKVWHVAYVGTKSARR